MARESPIFSISRHNSAQHFLSVAYPTLTRTLRHEKSANIVLAHALDRTTPDYILTRCRFLTEDEVNMSTETDPLNEVFWLTLWTTSGPSELPRLDIVLACTKGALGNHPIFLWSPPDYILTDRWLSERIKKLVQYLENCVENRRVFSVFGKAPLIEEFGRCWAHLTGFQLHQQAFYEAWLIECTPASFKMSLYHLPHGHAIRRATAVDQSAVADLCKGFSDTTIHFQLSLDGAKIQAQELIEKGQAWLYQVESKAVAICTVTRSSLCVSAITKVYTAPIWRMKGFAEHLVRYVTKTLFHCGKHSVVLYVEKGNRAARVYERVGFILHGNPDAELLEDALELGFEGGEIGHW
ncbi:hypothetical protein C8J56DRAFT_318445 [Mycena floridula]|nr:hypothetical protein C8J56DRAFT_318445 [Mycena floridula]